MRIAWVDAVNYYEALTQNISLVEAAFDVHYVRSKTLAGSEGNGMEWVRFENTENLSVTLERGRSVSILFWKAPDYIEYDFEKERLRDLDERCQSLAWRTLLLGLMCLRDDPECPFHADMSFLDVSAHERLISWQAYQERKQNR